MIPNFYNKEFQLLKRKTENTVKKKKKTKKKGKNENKKNEALKNLASSRIQLNARGR